MRPRTLGHHFSISQRENLNAARRANPAAEKGERRSCAQSRDLLFVSVVMMSYKKADKERERERERVCNAGLPLCSAPGVSSSIEVLGDRERENDLAD